MGSSYFGDRSLGDGRSGSSRKGKKSSSEKAKQPQRGLGVAQLEAIRLRNQMVAGHLPSVHPPPLFHSNINKEENVRAEMAFSSSPSSSSTSSSLVGLHPNTMLGFGGMERTDMRYCTEAQSSFTASRSPYNHTMLPHQYIEPQTVTLPLLGQIMEDSVQKKRRHDRCHSMGSISQNSDSSDTQELDLDLKLSL